ncbi:ABC transporter (plasmid) [Legionella adelaidensis]|uniref:ABC transporter n=1 Tax=Legionella adelaidensis TaxID=45056 RepID=A0A0W0R1Q7_9GAMM|nr:SbmA/BacA-like family transporter [Legionella adelaidensis]KTC65027.1 ABC transporter [Legionella adelaidensis]VEH85454.1 ABC transporter [Legionella adelaidensis]
MNTTIFPSPYRKALSLAKDYFFHSNDRLKAWLLLIGAVASVVTIAALTFTLSWWMTTFWAAMTAKNASLFFSSMRTFTLIVGSWGAVNALKDFCVEKLRARWRNWLSAKILPSYINEDNKYVDVSRHADQIDHPEQRIQEDIKVFTEKSITLSLDLLNSVLTLVLFTGSLWVVGGSLSFVVLGASITIPGYMVWSAILFAAGSSFITSLIGRRLPELNKKEESLEADIRKDLFILDKDSENIAQERGGMYYLRKLLRKFGELYNNWSQKIVIQLSLSAFKGVYQQVAIIFPYLMAAPAYFAGLLPFAQIMQISYSFSYIQSALSWFINSYEDLAIYKISTKRIMELERALEEGGLNTPERNIDRIEDAALDGIEIVNLDMVRPASEESSSTVLMMSQLNVKFPKGTHTVIQGENGIGKSTITKIIAGTWKYGHGEVKLPPRHKIYILPQKPTMPHDTLRAVLAYPEPFDTFTDEEYRVALQAVGEEEFIEKLDTPEDKSVLEDWSRKSGGQQQKIAFARAVLRKPEILILDESTAAMSKKYENLVYSLTQSMLKDSTIISIAHRDVGEFHDRAVMIEVDEATQRVNVTETPLRTSINDEEEVNEAVRYYPS